MIKDLPVKIKAKKVKKRYFNYLVFLSEDEKTIIEERNGKGIWQKLYQFPLIETNQEVNLAVLRQEERFKELTRGKTYSISVFNDQAIVHKLSHQHLYTKFWIITLNELPRKGLPVKKVKNYPFPTLINNFINEFNF